jgi:hypothetical protein
VGADGLLTIASKLACFHANAVVIVVKLQALNVIDLLP